MIGGPYALEFRKHIFRTTEWTSWRGTTAVVLNFNSLFQLERSGLTKNAIRFCQITSFVCVAFSVTARASPHVLASPRIPWPPSSGAHLLTASWSYHASPYHLYPACLKGLFILFPKYTPINFTKIPQKWGLFG